MYKFSKTKSLILFQILFIFGSSVFVFAVELKGIVVEKSTGNSLSGATVVVVGKSIQTTTGSNGRFAISDVPAGRLRGDHCHTRAFYTDAKGTDCPADAQTG